jgi:hypothetical protein
LQDGQQQMQSYGYVPYDATGTMYSQAPIYSQNVMYVPLSGNTSSTTTSNEQSPETKDRASETDQALEEGRAKK